MTALRPALPADRDALLSVLRAASWANAADSPFLAANPGVLDLPLSLIDSGAVLLAEVAGVPVAFATLLPPQDGLAEVEGLFVHPDHWRRGLGRALVTACAAAAGAAGARGLAVTANEAALPFWHAQGFAPIGTMQVASGTAQVLAAPLTLGALAGKAGA